MEKILVSLVSDQTIPNLQLIREFKDIDKYLFISTLGMKKKGTESNIINAMNLDDNKILPTIYVKPHSFTDFIQQLEKVIDYDDKKYFVNITGGTKMMALACFEFFKNLSSEIFYVTFPNNVTTVFPKKKIVSSSLDSKINLDEYLISYGFNIDKKGSILKPPDETNSLFKYFTKGLTDKDKSILEELRQCCRSKKISLDKIEGLKEFLGRIGFRVSENRLSKYEVQYLTGGWFEEYVYNTLRNIYDFEDDEIGIGYLLIKKEVPNEFDVLFIYNNKLFTIECKTSIYENDETGKSLLGGVLYKSDSLQSEFGLHPQTIVATLSSLKDSDGHVTQKLKTHIKRAKMKGIYLFGFSDFNDFESTLRNLLQI